MILDRCTNEFKKIYNRYRDQTNKTKKYVFNFQKILEERNNQLIDKQDEDEVLNQEAIESVKNKMTAGADDRAIHKRLKNEDKKEKYKHKFTKKNLLNILDVADKNNEADIYDMERKNTIGTVNTYTTSNTISSIYFSPLQNKLLKLPPIDNIDLNSITNKKDILNQKVKKIIDIIDNNYHVKKQISKMYNDKIQFEAKNLANASLSNIIHSRNNTDHSLFLQNTHTNNTRLLTEQITTKVNDEYLKRLNQLASKDETEKLLNIIEKQNRLKDYIHSIEKFENKINNAKERSIELLNKHESRANNFKKKYKRVFEKNFKF